MLCPVQPCNEERERQQKIADEKLLADAGISDLNNDEERQQILEVLRQSLPEGPTTSSSVSASAASHSQYTQPMDDGGESPHADVSMEYQQTPEVEIRSASSSPKPTHRQESSSITGQSVLQPQVHGSGVQEQRKAQRKCEKESDDGTESGPEPASDLDQRVRPKRTLRASVRRLETSSDSDCVGEPQKKRLLKSGTDASSDSDQSIRPLQERSELVGGKEPETPRSSQDLFTAGEGEEEKTGAGSQNSASQSTPADLPTFKACDKEEAETSGLDMEVEEVETLPPYSPAASLDSREGKEDVEDEDSVLSQEFPIQSTQARTIPIVMEDAVLTPASAPSPSLEADKTYFRPLNVDPAIFSGQILQLFNNAPAAKKPAIGEGVLKRTAHRTGSDRGIGSVQRTDTPVNSELGASSLNPWSSAASQTMEDTQPYDFDDDELPDISLNPGTKSGATNPLDVKTAMYLNDENKQAGKERLHSPPIDSSQSSNSRLDENGDLYPTQLPSREMKKGDCGAPSGEFFDDDDFVEESLSQRKQGASQSRQDRNEGPRLPRRNVSRSATDKPDAGEHSQAASRKRKQANDSSEVNLLELSDDEPSYPQKRKREVTSTVSSKGQGRQVKISMCADTSRYTATAAVIPPSTHIRTGGSSLSQQDSSQETKSKYFPGYERKGASHDTGTGECAGLSDAGQDPAIIGGTDDEDSVQFISLVHLDNGKERGQYQGATYSRAHSAKQKVPVQVMAEVEPRVECPLCGKQFPSSRIEQHASDCQGGEEEELVPQRATGRWLAERQTTSSAPAQADEVEIEEVPSDDSDRDPDFALTKDDFQQVKEDIQEDRDSHTGINKCQICQTMPLT
ncbi:hypothetical protein BaRGS_00020452 [Batillaria attramentaria]|uniref:Ubiquitin interaction motif-containing protein 1 n=1 Tax=Batillaria attramentaria TaxID=370345 RepID=A0ABD0KN25_9CAEN